MARAKMTTWIVVPLTLIACHQAGDVGAHRPCQWDDTYDSVIEAAPAFVRGDGAVVARSEVRRLARWMRSLSERARFREAMKPSEAAGEEVLLEAVFPVNDMYHAVWVHKGPGAPASLLAWNRDSLYEAKVSEEAWLQVERLLRSERLQGGLSAKVPDGTAFFVSWAVREACGQYVIYAPIFSSSMPDSEVEYQNSIGREKAVAQVLLRLARQAR